MAARSWLANETNGDFVFLMCCYPLYDMSVFSERTKESAKFICLSVGVVGAGYSIHFAVNILGYFDPLGLLLTEKEEGKNCDFNSGARFQKDDDLLSCLFRYHYTFGRHWL